NVVLHTRFLVDGVHALGWMQVERPATECDRSVKRLTLQDIVLSEDDLPDEAAAFTLARHEPDPIQGPIGGVGMCLASFGRTILVVIPDSQHDSLQPVAN